ncbi:hydrolase [Alteromonas sp. 1_MG-2023]|uniref:hydrolase n=1 Tax=Alteromonas sp. 1_MG-2023 TaxID=3062669 RepID=UPI0026E2B795|nr:hydrolase [Alteromonas sp. 1_MG-2023]MDO6474270.1 hydrolase [Alteromonas sp. 1_MG-2023]
MHTREHGHGVVRRSHFEPSWWARNRHIQTIWPRFFQKRRPVSYTWQRINTPDNDFLDLAWGPEPQNMHGMVVMFHGLEGSIRSHYANDMMAALSEQGWQVVMMHFRSCSGEINRQPRAYHSGETEDPAFFLDWLDKRFPDVPKVAIGFSLGGNMLLKLLGENPGQKWLQAAMAVSAPVKLDACSDSIGEGFSKVYQNYLLKSMKATLTSKMRKLDYKDLLSLTVEHAGKLASFREFDEKVTAPLHGFKDAQDYYEKCSAYPFLSAIHCPTLIVHSLDDPFMSPSIVPDATALSRNVTLELSEFGGHVGFMQGGFLRPVVWLQQRAVDYFSEFLPVKSAK